MKTAIIPGSFDPVTLGHLDIIRRAAVIFDKVYPVILVNAEKKSFFTEDERLLILKSATRNIPNAECFVFDGLASDFSEKVHAQFIVKGLRNTTDFEYELSLAEIMKHFGKNIETVFLPCSPSLSYISSTYAREKIKYGADLSDIADPQTFSLITDIFNSKKQL